MFQNNHLILQDMENNTLVSVISHCYKECIRRKGSTPELSEISDECLEYVTDYGIRMVTYCGARISAIEAIDIMLADILDQQGFIYKIGNLFINPHQLTMFDELF